MNSGDEYLVGMLMGAGVAASGVAAAESLSWAYTIGGMALSAIGLLMVAVKR